MSQINSMSTTVTLRPTISLTVDGFICELLCFGVDCSVARGPFCASAVFSYQPISFNAMVGDVEMIPLIGKAWTRVGCDRTVVSVGKICCKGADHVV